MSSTVQSWDQLRVGVLTHCHAYPYYHTHSFLTLCLLLSSADNLCKQFGPRSGPTFPVADPEEV